MARPVRFRRNYKCFPVLMLAGQERPELEDGGKIILPQSVLRSLTRLDISYPMLFKLINAKSGRETHCGVLEFIAEEGRCYLPNWMMRNILIQEGESLQVEIVNLPTATFSMLQPQSTDFLSISNPKAVLESALRNFSCLTTGDIIAIHYNEKLYELKIMETKPASAVTIIECDMDVDFAPPVGYEEPKKPGQKSEEEESQYTTSESDFVPFGGSGIRLDGKSVDHLPGPSNPVPHHKRGIPDYDWQVGNLQFFRNAKFHQNSNEKKTTKRFVPFGGAGTTIRGNKERKLE